MSDSSDRNIVIFVFIFIYLYINYLRIKIDIKNDWENMRCNPMNLWTSSFIRDPSIANKNFNNCINSIGAQSIQVGLDEAYKTQREALQEISNQEIVVRNHLENIDKNINQSGGLKDQYKINELKIEDIKKEQTTYKTVNDLLTDKTQENNLYNFVTNVNSIFNNIKSYLPSILN